jgi:hypothetical protein
MANKHRGEIAICLDKERTLRLTSNSIVKVEKELGFPITKLNEDTLGFEAIRALLWAGLLHEIKDLTPDEAGDLMDKGDFEEISERISEALTLVFQKGSNQTGKK